MMLNRYCHEGGVEEALENLIEVGISQEEAKKMIYDYETEYHVPDNSTSMLRCPNCGEVVNEHQEFCGNNRCTIRLCWRVEG